MAASITKKEITYSLGCLWIVFHDERKTIGVRSVVSMTSQSEMPSTPSAYVTPHCGIQVRISTSCKPATPSWNPLTMPSEATNVAPDASSPKPLIAPAALLGKNTSSAAAAMGSQRVMLSTFIMLVIPSVSEGPGGAGGAPHA